jgi:hypothetical protein
MAENNQAELLNGVLSITRDQLTRSMNMATELEALLIIERKKTAELEAKVTELKAALEEKKK